MTRSKKADRIITSAKDSEHQAESRRLQLEINRLRSDLKASLDERAALESQLEAATELGKHKCEHKLKRTISGKSSGASVVLPACDWHYGEEIKFESVNGINEFNISIAEQRIARYYSKALELVEWYGHLAPVTEIWHPLLGDLISGDIHDDLRESNEATASEAVLAVQDLLVSGIKLLRTETKLPVIVPTVPGNHGRSTQKIRIKTDTRNSWEQMLYRSIAKNFAKDKDVDVRVGESLLNEQVVAGRKCRFLHGHVIRYYGGVGGISVPVNKAVQAWNEINDCDFTIFGHYHAFQWYYPRWVACGCLVGASEFSVWIRAPWQHPSQTFIAVDPQYGMTACMPIFVKEPKRKRNG